MLGWLTRLFHQQPALLSWQAQEVEEEEKQAAEWAGMTQGEREYWSGIITQVVKEMDHPPIRQNLPPPRPVERFGEWLESLMDRTDPAEQPSVGMEMSKWNGNI